MNEVELKGGYWSYGETAIPISATVDEINERIESLSTQIANLILIRDKIEESGDLLRAIEAMHASSVEEYRFYGDRFIEGYMAALKERGNA